MIFAVIIYKKVHDEANTSYQIPAVPFGLLYTSILKIVSKSLFSLKQSTKQVCAKKRKQSHVINKTSSKFAEAILIITFILTLSSYGFFVVPRTQGVA